MQSTSVYAQPQNISNVDQCYFYHTMEIPGHGIVKGEWDLRKDVGRYLGNIDLRGKRVLEIGTASGFLCFEMENAGAQVVAYDLSDAYPWDIVPFARFGPDKLNEQIAERKAHIRKLNNGWWFAHKAHGSKAKVVYGTVYDIPREIGQVDIATFCSVLLHVRDPFLALYNGLSQTRERVVIAEKVRGRRWLFEATRRLGLPYMSFLPDHATCKPLETWWSLSPDVLRKMIRVLGFERTQTTFYELETNRGKELFFTLIGERIAGPIEAA